MKKAFFTVLVVVTATVTGLVGHLIFWPVAEFPEWSPSLTGLVFGAMSHLTWHSFVCWQEARAIRREREARDVQIQREESIPSWRKSCYTCAYWTWEKDHTGTCGFRPEAPLRTGRYMLCSRWASYLSRLK